MKPVGRAQEGIFIFQKLSQISKWKNGTAMAEAAIRMQQMEVKSKSKLGS